MIYLDPDPDSPGHYEPGDDVFDEQKDLMNARLDLLAVIAEIALSPMDVLGESILERERRLS